jgi:hypothetical protein
MRRGDDAGIDDVWRTGLDGLPNRLADPSQKSLLTPPVPWGPDRPVSSETRPRGRFDYFLVESTGLSELLPGAEPRRGRRTVLTFPLLPPPQKN